MAAQASAVCFSSCEGPEGQPLIRHRSTANIGTGLRQFAVTIKLPSLLSRRKAAIP